MNDPFSPIVRDQLSGFLEQGLKDGLPPFVTPELSATPLNSTPYVCSLEKFRQIYGDCGRRRLFVETLTSALNFVRRSGIVPRALLIGGSVNDRTVACPSDLDVVVFYEVVTSRLKVEMLESVRSALRRDGVDARFLPIDVNPILLMKFTSFFSVLFSKSGQGSVSLTRGLLLVDLSDDQAI